MRGKDFAFLEWKALQIKTVHTLEGAVRNCGLFWEPYRGTPAWRVRQNKATWAQPAWARLLKLFTDIKSLWAVTTSCYLGRMYVVWSDTEGHVRWNLEGLGVFQEAERIWYDRDSSPLIFRVCSAVLMSFGFDGRKQPGVSSRAWVHCHGFILASMMVWLFPILSYLLWRSKAYSIIKTTECY